MILFGREIATRTIQMVGGAIVLLVVLSLLLWQCDRRRSEKAQDRVDDAQVEAAQNSAADAINTVEQAGKREASSEDLTRSNEREIRGADGAGDRVKPGVDYAGRAALCRREAYKNDPKCQKKVPK